MSSTAGDSRLGGGEGTVSSLERTRLDLRLATLNLMEDAALERQRSEIEAAGRRWAEQTLGETQEQFRRAVEDAPIPVIMFTEDGWILQINRAWAELTGYSLNDMAAFERWLDQPEEARRSLREQMRHVFEKEGPSEQLDISIRTRDNELRSWLLSTSVPGRLRDGQRFAVGMAQDITERKRAEEALARSEERLRLVVENAREFAIFSTDLQRRVTTWNPGAEQLLGWSEKEILGQSADIIFVPEDRAAGACEREAETALSQGRAADERWHQRKDRTRFWGSGVMMAMQGSGTETIGFVKILRDQTSAKNASEELERSRLDVERSLAEAERARQEAEAANRAKDQFLATLSHELRTPLTPVLIHAESLLKRKDLPQRAIESLKTICRNVEVENHLISDLLDVTRLSRGTLELNSEAMNIHDSIQTALEISEPDLRFRKQRLSIDLAAADSRIMGDNSRLQQVFWNLLKNASKFTGQEGRIDIRSRNEPGCVVVEVQDEGMGIDHAFLPHVFEAFRQGDTSVTRRYGGLGLGLAISKAIVEAHGGKIFATSDGLGKGANFTVRIPLATLTEAGGAP